MSNPHVDGKITPVATAVVLAGVVAAAFHFSLAPTAPKLAPFVALTSIYGLAAVFAVVRLKRKHDLALIRPKSGDITTATLVAALLYGLAYVLSVTVLARGTPRESWLVHIYLLLAEAFRDGRHFLSVGLFVIGALEELAWRGLVLEGLETRVGRFQATLLTSAFWAAAHVPTLYRLGDPVAGPNPLLVLAAFGCGLVWSYLRYRTDRLTPSLISHAIFSWAIVEFPLWHF